MAEDIKKELKRGIKMRKELEIAMKLCKFKKISNIVLAIFSIKGALMMLTGIIDFFSNVFDLDIMNAIGGFVHFSSGAFMLASALCIIAMINYVINDELNDNKNKEENIDNDKIELSKDNQ